MIIKMDSNIISSTALNVIIWYRIENIFDWSIESNSDSLNIFDESDFHIETVLVGAYHQPERSLTRRDEN